MTDSPAPARPAKKARPARKPRPQGQWKVDGTEPLNDDERIKQEAPGLSVMQRIRDVYSKEGFDSIPAADLAPRFKWVGMYTQRKQGLNGEKTSTLTNAELQDNFFMMRIRLDGGQVSTEQLRTIGRISENYARNTADFTDRQNVQLHWVRIEDVPTIWDELENVGLNTRFGCGDVPRVILGSPVAGIAKDEIIDATPAIKKIKEESLLKEEFHNLPRKFKTAISGNGRQDVTHEMQDVAFIGSVHPEHGPGFDVWVGGGLSTNPMLAKRLGVWCPLEEVQEVWEGVVKIFRDYGYRKVRNRARLKFLVADWGIEKFRQVLEEEYLGRTLIDGDAPEEWPGYRDHVGIHEQQDGKVYLGVKPTVGHTDGQQLQRLADTAERYGVSRIRTTADKELLFLDLSREDAEKLAKELEETEEHLSAQPSAFRRDIISCTGLEYCKLAHVVTKQRAIALVDELEERLGDLDVPLKISLNGCPNSCARTQLSDIGFSGKILTTDEGERVEGFQVHLGGSVGLRPDFGKKVRGNQVFSKDLGDYVVRIVENFKAGREEGEQFRDWVLRADDELLV
ncbi:nitrite/sulfite reductase [Corynebacterium sp. zg254]|uniref:assimilatory sulfite reductase (ferredoxin) n=1 Tax=Corynebacterium zhongnanshanii TaxID=2768834 RepID=A0ABQ6VG27_9CORY|nr:MULTISPECIES: nitrite/sulfite reductase [Corynebacterium]KAB3519891.1 nitrite/sulfite reductase [Corynebacterium zhongnanshanii]MCR5914835.1 nitrite/sulfite reductase [Corynebacterium sp. zg254]